MQANPRSLDTLFNSQLRYVVPMFQRLYVWKETPQWSTLWEDVSEKALLLMRGVKSNPHYLGALIIEGVKPNSPREVKRFLIIDGQQRLTTLQLLFCAYRDIARALGKPGAERAVGAANGRTRIGIIVPCHRVIGADGGLTGYAAGIDKKRWLLAHEGAELGLGLAHDR